MIRKALVIGIHPWHSPLQVGSHAIARQLAATGWKVAYVSAPITPFHWLRPNQAGFRERLAIHRRGGDFDALAKVWHYVPFALLAPDHRPMFNSRWMFEHWQRTSLPDVARHVAAHGFGDVDLLLLNSHFQPFWLEAIRFRRSVYRLADLNAGFPGYGPSASKVETALARRVDLVVTAAHTLVEQARRMGAREVMALPNGIAFQDFAQRPAEPPPEYRAMRGPIAVYVGAIGGWIDLALIRHCALQLPHVQFVLIAPTEGLEGRWTAMPNVHPIGARPRSSLPAYLHYAQVGLMPFDREAYPQLVDHVHPLKLYEYLACGLPVVSTDWAELHQFPHPAVMCGNASEFAQALSNAISSPGTASERVACASQADWSRQVERLLARVAL